MLPYLISSRDPDQLLNHAFKLWNSANAETIKQFDNLTIRQFNHPDLYLLPADPDATSIGVDDVRQLILSLQLKPIQASSKLALIHHADLLTIPAQNALLKTLEEPPPHTQIILTSTKPHSLLPTVLSRVVHTKITNSLSAKSQTKANYAKLTTILSLPPAQRLTQTQAIAATRDSAREFLINSLHYFHQLLITNDQTRMTNDQLLITIKLLTKSLKYLDANTHPQLTIDWLFLHLPHSS